jgi:hypothetical protein
MNEIKPNWKMARQISRRHTLISSGLTTALLLSSNAIAWIILKLMGYPNAYHEMKLLIKQYQREISYLVLFIHLVPVNLYAIILTVRYHFRTFRIAVLPTGV